MFDGKSHPIVLLGCNLFFLGDEILEFELIKHILTMRSVVYLVSVQLTIRYKETTLGQTMEEGPTIITIALVEGKDEGYASGVGDGRHLGCVPTTIKRRRTDTLASKHVLDKGGINNKGRRPGSDLAINTKEVVIGVLKEVMFRPEGKIMVDGLPRAVRDGETRPLATRRQDKMDPVEDIREG